METPEFDKICKAIDDFRNFVSFIQLRAQRPYDKVQKFITENNKYHKLTLESLIIDCLNYHIP
ncbi:MAG: hypothetical protein NVSMB67_23600 [Flavisolibacter sp.]